jgi:hypothetical protein
LPGVTIPCFVTSSLKSIQGIYPGFSTVTSGSRPEACRNDNIIDVCKKLVLF